MFTARHYLSLSLCFLVAVCSAAHSFGADWIVKRSRYTHDPNTQARVTQYSPIGPFYANDMPNYQKSGYRQSRSSIQVGPSADHIHIVETWGQPVEPYGQWRYPYRPYSAPYQAWGPPFGGLNIGVGAGFFPPYGGFGGGGPGFGPGGVPGAGAGLGPGSGAGPGMGPGVVPGGPGGGPGFGPGGGGPGFGPGFGGGYGGGYSPSYGGGYGGNYYPPNNWTNPFNGPPGVDEYYPDAPSPSRLQPWGPRGF